MKTRMYVPLLAGLALAVAAALPASAQTRTDASYDKEFGVKYSLLYEESDWASFGVLLEGGAKVCQAGTWSCSIVGELGFNHFGGDFDTTYTTYQGGVRLGKVLNEKTRPFFQFLVGGQHCCGGENAFVFTLGGGFNYALLEKMDLQVQADFPFARYFGETFNQFRLSVGVGLPLGTR